MSDLFPGQQTGEQVYLIIREHWFYLAARLSLWFLVALALAAFNYFVPLYFPTLSTEPYATYISLGKNIYLVFMVLGIFMSWVMYRLNVKIVTDQRVVDITHDTIFSHTISELSLAKIEDVTSETTGIFGSMFSYGNVYIQTAGREERFTFKTVPDPDKLERLILNLYDRKMGNTPGALAKQEDV